MRCDYCGASTHSDFNCKAKERDRKQEENRRYEDRRQREQQERDEERRRRAQESARRYEDDRHKREEERREREHKRGEERRHEEILAQQEAQHRETLNAIERNAHAESNDEGLSSDDQARPAHWRDSSSFGGSSIPEPPYDYKATSLWRSSKVAQWFAYASVLIFGFAIMKWFWGTRGDRSFAYFLPPLLLVWLLAFLQRWIIRKAREQLIAKAFIGSLGALALLSVSTVIALFTFIAGMTMAFR